MSLRITPGRWVTDGVVVFADKGRTPIARTLGKDEGNTKGSNLDDAQAIARIPAMVDFINEAARALSEYVSTVEAGNCDNPHELLVKELRQAFADYALDLLETEGRLG